MCGPLETSITGNQDFAAPDLAVGAISGADKSNTDHPALEMVFRHTTRDVRVVVLYTNHMRSSPLSCPLGGEVSGVEVVGDNGRFNFQNPLKMPDPFFEKAITFDIF